MKYTYFMPEDIMDALKTGEYKYFVVKDNDCGQLDDEHLHKVIKVYKYPSGKERKEIKSKVIRGKILGSLSEFWSLFLKDDKSDWQRGERGCSFATFTVLTKEEVALWKLKH